MTSKIQFRRDTAANWTATNPILSQGEPGFETDTGKVKYGDGTTSWNDLGYSSEGDVTSNWQDGINDNVWRITTVSGTKEFDFESEGWKLFEYTFTDAQTGLSEWTFDVADYPEVADMWWNSNTEENSYYIYKGDADSENGMLANYDSYNNGILTIVMDGYDFAVGEKITIKYWTEGTRTLNMSYDTYDAIPDATVVGTTNTVVIDADELGFAGSATALLENFSRHSINFKAYSRTFSRNVTNVINNGDVYTITFDGDPIAIKAITLQEVGTTSGNAGESSTTLEIPYSAIPEFGLYAKFGWEWNTNTQKYTGGVNRSGYVIINSGDPINFAFWNAKNSDTKNWYLELFDAATWAEGDQVEVHWYKVETRMTIDIYYPNNIDNNWNNGYRWFDWKTDMSEYNALPDNGIIGGKGTVISKVYTEEKDYSNIRQFHFAWAAYDNDDEYDPIDPYRDSQVWNGTDDNQPFYYFDREDGMVFRSRWTMNGDFSRKLKVRIMYKFEFNINGEQNWNWWSC